MRIRALEIGPGGFDVAPARARVGLVLLATDLTIEGDVARLAAGSGVAFHIARVAYPGETTPETLRALLPRLGEAAASPAAGERLDALGFGCTSASALLGPAVDEAFGRARPGAPVVTPVSAAAEGFAGLGVRRVAILTPYVEAAARPVAEAFEGAGLEVVSLAHLGVVDDRDMARLSRARIVELAVEADDPAADALFVSCTALRAAEVVAEIEARTGKPVVTANQALIWRCLRLAGWAGAPAGAGGLFELGADVARSAA